MSTIVHDYVDGEHLPPVPLSDRDSLRICELGTNIGTGIAGLAARYPRARLLGVEPDGENARIARLNVSWCADRCSLVEAAIWDRDAELVVEGTDPSGLTVREAETGDAPDRRVAGVTVESLLQSTFADAHVDYLILNLEGAEPRVLAAGAAWASRVGSIRCELHPSKGFDAERCVELLTALGFEAWAETEWWGGWGFGIAQDRGRPR